MLTDIVNIEISITTSHLLVCICTDSVRMLTHTVGRHCIPTNTQVDVCIADSQELLFY